MQLPYELAVPELRRDYFTERLTLTSNDRGSRGTDIPEDIQESGRCFVCDRIGNQKNKPALPLIIEHPDNLAVSSKSEEDGSSHVSIIASLIHNSSFQNLSVEDIVKMLTSAQENMKLQYSKKDSFVIMLSRYGNTAGAIMHPSLEIFTIPEVPSIVAEEMASVERSVQDLGICPMCRVIGVEQGGPRQLISTEHFIAFAPWAPTSSYEFWVYPKLHDASFLKMSSKALNDLALILRSTLGGMQRELGRIRFNMVFHTINDKKSSEYHWHIEVHPLLNMWGSIEKGLGVFVNDIAPEMTGEVLGRASRKELAELVGI